MENLVEASPILLDIVVATSTGNLSFLENWRPFFQPFHIIIVQAGEVARPLKIPHGFDCRVITREDIKKILGLKASYIPVRESACRCIGWLLSKKRYVFTLAENCLVAEDPYSRESIDAVQQHITNLSTAATPFFFNTLYDPYRESTDFVRGYPFSLREGTPTAISHGLWLNVPDYDAPTRMVKPSERNAHYVDAVVSIPKGALFPMSSLNLAFDRDLIGPAMYFPFLGEGHPIGLHGDMWAGWCAKVICDHLGYGAKSGLPYVSHENPNSAFVNLKKEYPGIMWQEQMIPFLQSVRLPDTATTAAECYLEIANQVSLLTFSCIRNFLSFVGLSTHNLRDHVESIRDLARSTF
eukprot:jgi/Mesen1/2469/ME000158S01659